MQDTYDLYGVEKTTFEKCQILAGDVAAQINRINVCQDALNQYCKFKRRKNKNDYLRDIDK